MKKTIAILLVLAVVMTGVFAVNVQLKSTVTTDSGITDPTNNPAGISVWGVVEGSNQLVNLSAASDVAVLTNAKLTPTAEGVEEYNLVAYYTGNKGVAYAPSVSITPSAFSSGTTTSTVDVTASASEVQSIINGISVTPTNPGTANALASAIVSVESGLVVLEKTPVADFKLSWTPDPTVVAGEYVCDVQIAITNP